MTGAELATLLVSVSLGSFLVGMAMAVLLAPKPDVDEALAEATKELER